DHLERHAARRARDDRRARDPERTRGGASVSDDRPLLLHRRLLARRQGRSALRQSGGQSDQAVRLEQRRPGAQRLSRGCSERAQARVQAVLQIGAQFVAGARARAERASRLSGSTGIPGVLRAQQPWIGDVMAGNAGAKVVRVGVIGAGALGYHHTRILRDVPGAQLVGFHDAKPERAAQVSSELGVQSFESLDALLDRVDAVSVVVPTPFHYTVAAPALERGLHVLIEKPIAT